MAQRTREGDGGEGGMKKYRLLKDLPGIKAGEIFEYGCQEEAYLTGVGRIHFGKEVMPTCDDWFEEVKEEYKGMTAGQIKNESFKKEALECFEKIGQAKTLEEKDDIFREYIQKQLQDIKPETLERMIKKHQPKRKAPAYVWNRKDMSDWHYTGCFNSENDAKIALYRYPYDETPFKYIGVQWPALPDKDGYYPGPKR